MDIAMLSIGLNQAKLCQSVGISLQKKAMNQQEGAVSQLIEQMQSANPPSNHKLDVRA